MGSLHPKIRQKCQTPLLGFLYRQSTELPGLHLFKEQYIGCCNITKIISSNNILFNQRFDILSKEIGDITESLQFFQNQTEENDE